MLGSMSIELDLLAAIRRLAGPDVAADAESFVVRSGELAIQVRYSGGSSSSLTLSAPYNTVARRAPASGQADSGLTALRGYRCDAGASARSSALAA